MNQSPTLSVPSQSITDQSTNASPSTQQLQYKIQILLHINSLLLSKLYTQQQTLLLQQQQQQEQTTEQKIHSDYLKRVHANLQCISQLHQGVSGAKPSIMEPPVSYYFVGSGDGHAGSMGGSQVGQTNNAPGHTGSTNDALIKQQEEGLRRLYLLLNRMFEIW